MIDNIESIGKVRTDKLFLWHIIWNVPDGVVDHKEQPVTSRDPHERENTKHDVRNGSEEREREREVREERTPLRKIDRHHEWQEIVSNHYYSLLSGILEHLCKGQENIGEVLLSKHGDADFQKVQGVARCDPFAKARKGGNR